MKIIIEEKEIIYSFPKYTMYGAMGMINAMTCK